MSLEHWVWLSELNIERREKAALLEHFSEPQRIYESTEQELQAVRLKRASRDEVLRKRNLKRARALISRCEQLSLRIVTMQDAAYPDRLRSIEVPPVLLYVGGQMPSFDEEAAIAVVGTRHCSEMSENIAYTFGYELSEKGMLVVSGMAMGIDAAANAGALAAGARTVAVLGCGADVCYPESSRPVYDCLLSGRGCVISEYAPGTPPKSENFPPRNRIISGLSAGVLIVAAPARSGSLITASRALEQGREIFVIPGGIQEREFEGSNALIKTGAIPVTSAKDIVAYYYPRFPEAFDPERILSYMQSDGETAERIRKFRNPVVLRSANRPETAKTEETETRGSGRSGARRLLSLLTGDRRQSEKTETGNAEEEKAGPIDAVPAAEPKQIDLPEYFTEAHRSVIGILQSRADGTAHIDEIVNLSALPAADVLSVLTDLELEGTVTALPGKRFQIR